MATQSSVAKRRGEAEAAIKTAVSALAEKYGVGITNTTYPVRDIELRRVMDLESMAANLTAIIDGSGLGKAAKATEKPKAESVVEDAAIIEEAPKKAKAKVKGKASAKKK